MSTITGTPGTNIAAVCTGPTAGNTVLATNVNAPLQSIENDLATIKAMLTTALPFQMLDSSTWNDTITGDAAFHDSGFVLLNFPGCKVGDVIMVWLSGLYATNSTNGVIEFGFRDDFAGTNVLSAVLVTPLLNTTPGSSPIALAGAHTVTVAGTCRFVLRLKQAAAQTLNFFGPGSLFGLRSKASN